jgi:hypothetical protein
LEQKLNNQGKRMWSNRFAPLANPYTASGKSLKFSGQVMKELEAVAKRVAVEASESKAEAEEEVSEKGAEEEERVETEEEEEETRGVTMEEEDTVSPLRKQGVWKTVGRKEKENATKEAESRANTVGIKMVRIGKAGKTGWCPGDVRYFFEMLRRIDPSAMVKNARNEKASAMTVKEVEMMSAVDYKGYLDMRNDSWGKPTENKMKTVWMCHVATDVLTPQLQQLRDDRTVQEYLKQGDISMQYTKLHESNSKVAYHFANKDPKYTNRNDLEERLQQHVNRFSEKIIPIHVLNMAVSGKNFNTRMCTAVVGGKDIRKVESILKENPFTELEIIPFAWKFQDIEGYTRRLKEHEGVLKLCRAIKLEKMSVSDELLEFKTLMEADKAHEFVIDIFPATHATRTGIIYVQYINEHKNEVLEAIKDAVRTIKDARVTNETILEFPEGPIIVNTNGSVAPTIQTATHSTKTTTTNRTGITIPSSRYGGLLNQGDEVVSAPSQVPWAISIHNKSFRDATIRRLTSPENSDSESDTFRSGITSSKSNREVELENENQKLSKQLQDKDDQYQMILKQVQEGFDRQRLRDQEYLEQQYSTHKQEMLLMQAEHKEQMNKIATENKKQIEGFKAIILELAKQIDKKATTAISHPHEGAGSTPKRQKKRPVSTTPNRPEPAMAGDMQDEETTTLEEGSELT